MKNQSPSLVPQGASLGISAVGCWTFLTNYSHVLLCLYRQPDARLRDIAAAVGITERMVQRVIAELEAAGYVRITKLGRRNRYSINLRLKLRHPLEKQHTIGELLALLSAAPKVRPTRC